jgi:hypothetical protein
MKSRKAATFQMAGFTIPVSFVSKKEANKGKFWGRCECYSNTPQVELDSSLRGERLHQVLLHEMLHLAGDISGVLLSEANVEKLSLLLRQAFKTMTTITRKKGR